MKVIMWSGIYSSNEVTITKISMYVSVYAEIAGTVMFNKNQSA